MPEFDYVATVWKTGDIITAEGLNNMEDGVSYAVNTADAAVESVGNTSFEIDDDMNLVVTIPPGSATTIGRVGFVPRGDYDPETEYHKYDVVIDDGNSYVAKTTVTGVTPGTDETKW